MPRRYHDECPDCLDRELEIQALKVELSAARQNAMRYELEVHALRREIQALRMDRRSDTERITR